MPTIDEELIERQEEEERRKKQQNVIRNTGKRQLEKQVEKKVVKAAARAMLAGLWPYIIGAIVFIIIFLLVLFIIVGTFVALCNPEGLTGRLAKAGLSFTGVIPQGLCESFGSLGGGAVSYIDQVQIPPVGGQTCPSNIKPPSKSIIDCPFCKNIEEPPYNIPVKPRPPPGSTDGANPFADEEMASKLKGLFLANQTWRVTEAFCPTVNHNSPNHYNGRAVDINLKPEFSQDKQKLARLYFDAKQIGFVNVLCEYPIDFLKEYGVVCAATEKTAGGHIHIEVPGL